MPLFVKEESYKKLINEDIERLEKEMKHSPERDHIKAVLLWSVNELYNDSCSIITSGNEMFPLNRIDVSGSE